MFRTCLKSFSLRHKTTIFEHRSAVYTRLNEQRSTKNRCFMAKIRDFKKFFWVSFLGLSLMACGFHLRGNVPLPKTLSPMYISTNKPYDPLVQLIESTLTASHIELVDSPKQAKTLLNIIDIQSSENLVSVAASTNTRQYSLSETLRMELTTNKGKPIIPVSSLNASNPLTVDSNEVLNTSTQKQTLQQEMQQALVQQLMMRLSSSNTTKALAEANMNE